MRLLATGSIQQPSSAGLNRRIANASDIPRINLPATSAQRRRAHKMARQGSVRRRGCEAFRGCEVVSHQI